VGGRQSAPGMRLWPSLTPGVEKARSKELRYEVGRTRALKRTPSINLGLVGHAIGVGKGAGKKASIWEGNIRGHRTAFS